MAKFSMELPLDLINEFKQLSDNSEEMLGEMTRAGAKKVFSNVKKNMKKSFKSTERLEKHLKITRTYKTKADDGINTKIGIYGYLDGDKNKPAPLIANAREFGAKRKNRGVEPAKPFFRKSFKKNEIEEAMFEVQDKYLPKE